MPSRDRRGAHPSSPEGEAEERQPEQGVEDSIDEVRRRLLKIAIYTPPAIVGTVLVSSEARAQATPSCGPASCVPASPGCGPGPGCGPATCKPRT